MERQNSSVSAVSTSQLDRVATTQWPNGHAEHLTDNQVVALEKFKQLCQDAGCYSPADEASGRHATHDDETMLRFLRARKFVPQQAFEQFRDTEDWRKVNELDSLYENIDIDEYDRARRLYPQWTGRRDKRGIPFYVFDVGAVDTKAVTAYSNSKDTQKTTAASNKTSWKMLILFALSESLTHFVFPLCSSLKERPHVETPISQTTNIVDLSGVGIGKFWSLRNHLGDSSKLATAYYPEMLDRIFIIGAPSFFPTIWNFIKGLFDPITVAKIYIVTKENRKDTLEKFVDIDNIPKKYGGNLDWSFGDMPNLDPAIVESVRWEEHEGTASKPSLPYGPIKICYDESGELVANTIGSKGGQKRNGVMGYIPLREGVPQLPLSTRHADGSKSPPGSHVPPVASKQTNSTANPDNDASKTAESSLPETSRAGTYTVPYRDTNNAISSPPHDSRQGTSTMRYAQQDQTHAAGQLADGTPEIVHDGQGDRQAIMDPRTVGQAPKEHPAPAEEEGTEQSGMLASAKGAAGSLLAAVGWGSSSKEQETGASAEEEKKDDPEVDAAPKQNVEEYLRSKTMSAKVGA